MEPNIRNKFFNLQKVRRPRIFLNESSELAEQNGNVEDEIVVVDENIEPIDDLNLANVDGPEIIEFEMGTTNKGGACYWHAG